jgi:hypothetical protein
MSRDYASLPNVGLADVYPVGVLKTAQSVARALTATGIPNGRRLPAIRREVHREASYLRRQIAARNWRAVRNSFNGYLAEPYAFPDGMTRCGSGWTRRRAINDLLRHYQETR